MSAVGAARVQMTVIITTRKSSVMGHVGHGSVHWVTQWDLLSAIWLGHE